jgi:hypothetical protein
MSVDVIDNPSAGRFEATVDGIVAFLEYAIDGDRIVLIHTEVPEALGGKGVGGALVSFARDYAKERALTIVPRCPFARSWLERNHPEEVYGDA